MNWINKLFALFCMFCFSPITIAGDIAPEGTLIVKDPVQSFEQEGDYRTISVVGMLENTSSSYIDDVVIEAQFFNSKGELIDAYTEHQYSAVIPPNDTIAFALSKQAIHESGEYSDKTVRVTYAETKSSCKDRKDNLFVSMLINWAPLIIIVGAWILIMYRFQKKSPQAKTIELIEQQNELIRKNGEQFKEFLEVAREYTKKKT
jgi:ATP-dependent Zn protease